MSCSVYDLIVNPRAALPRPVLTKSFHDPILEASA